MQKYRAIIQHSPTLENIEIYCNSNNNRRDLNFELGGETTLLCPVMLVVGDHAPHEVAVVDCNSKIDPTRSTADSLSTGTASETM
ncbi:hypothetical protein [Salmonella enterica]|uniref:hypothetical protein n=1 Tax=Salmonella enterica TaxID=28901 RepID=UPI003D7683D8